MSSDLRESSSDGVSALSHNTIEPFPEDPVALHADNDLAGQTSAHTQTIQLSNTTLYLPLQWSSCQIRVARILPGTWREVVRCELTALDLNADSTKYEAISYCWGDEKDTTKIVINEHQVPVTVTLHDALRRLRRKDKERIVWADAICINQGDLEERQQQVQMMRDIYSGAATVQVFMGESLASRSALEHFDPENWDELPVCRWYNDDRDLPRLQSPAGKSLTLEHPGMAEQYVFVVLSMLGRHGCLKRVYDSLKTTPWAPEWASILSVLDELFERPWWCRVWVVQEVVLAREAFIHFGQTVLPWEMLDAVYDKVLAHYDQQCCNYAFESESIPTPTWDVISRLFHRLSYMRELRKVAATSDLSDSRSLRGGGSQLLRLLVTSKNRDAKDQRDKVYGMLGLLSRGWWDSRGVDPIVPDYTRDVISVFTDACLKVIATSGSLQILSHNAPGKVTHHLPSWVPDWCYDGTLGGTHNVTSQFAFNGDSLGDSRAVVSLEQREFDPPRGKALRIRGILIGTVGQTALLPKIGVSKDVPEHNGTSDMASLISRAIGDGRRISQLSLRPSDQLEDHTLSGEEVNFWTTLLGDQCATKEVLDRHRSYQSWIRGHDGPPGSDLSAPSIGTTNPQPGGEGSRTEPQKSTDGGVGESTIHWRYIQARTFIRLENGSLGITTVECLPGDQVYWFLGGWYPFILRKRPTSREHRADRTDGEGTQDFELIGPCDIPDIMVRKLWEEESHDVVLV